MSEPLGLLPDDAVQDAHARHGRSPRDVQKNENPFILTRIKGIGAMVRSSWQPAPFFRRRSANSRGRFSDFRPNWPVTVAGLCRCCTGLAHLSRGLEGPNTPGKRT